MAQKLSEFGAWIATRKRTIYLSKEYDAAWKWLYRKAAWAGRDLSHVLGYELEKARKKEEEEVPRLKKAGAKCVNS